MVTTAFRKIASLRLSVVQEDPYLQLQKKKKPNSTCGSVGNTMLVKEPSFCESSGGQRRAQGAFWKSWPCRTAVLLLGNRLWVRNRDGSCSVRGGPPTALSRGTAAGPLPPPALQVAAGRAVLFPPFSSDFARCRSLPWGEAEQAGLSLLLSRHSLGLRLCPWSASAALRACGEHSLAQRNHGAIGWNVILKGLTVYLYLYRWTRQHHHIRLNISNA